LAGRVVFTGRGDPGARRRHRWRHDRWRPRPERDTALAFYVIVAVVAADSPVFRLLARGARRLRHLA